MNYDGLGSDGLCIPRCTVPFDTQSHSRNENITKCLQFINIVYSNYLMNLMNCCLRKKSSSITQNFPSRLLSGIHRVHRHFQIICALCCRCSPPSTRFRYHSISVDLLFAFFIPNRLR